MSLINNSLKHNSMLCRCNCYHHKLDYIKHYTSTEFNIMDSLISLNQNIVYSSKLVIHPLISFGCTFTTSQILIRELSGEATTCFLKPFDLIGGKVQYGETFHGCMIREFREEMPDIKVSDYDFSPLLIEISPTFSNVIWLASYQLSKKLTDYIFNDPVFTKTDPNMDISRDIYCFTTEVWISRILLNASFVYKAPRYKLCEFILRRDTLRCLINDSLYNLVFLSNIKHQAINVFMSWAQFAYYRIEVYEECCHHNQYLSHFICQSLYFGTSMWVEYLPNIMETKDPLFDCGLTEQVLRRVLYHGKCNKCVSESYYPEDDYDFDDTPMTVSQS